MANDWIGIVSASAPKYVKGAEDQTIRKRLALAMLKERGLIQLGVDGSYETQYNVDYKEAPVQPIGDAGTITFARRDYYKRATMDWRGYNATDELTEKEYYETKGQYSLVRRYEKAIPKLVSSMQNQFGLELYIDGNAAGNEDRFCGIESFMGASSTTSAAYLVIEPDDSYNNIATDLNQSGTWSSGMSTKPNANLAYDWPEGVGSTDFDFFAPKLVNWSSTGWGTSSATWEDNCERVLRRTLQWLQQTAGSDEGSLICFLAGNLMSGFKDRMSAKLRDPMPHPEARDLGFPGTLNFEGLGIKSEFGISANLGYVMDLSKLELMFNTPEMIVTEGPWWNREQAKYLFRVVSYGNFKWNPKYFAKLKNYA